MAPKSNTSGAPAPIKLPSLTDAPTRQALDRITTMSAALDHAKRVLMDRTTSRERRTALLTFVDRMWSAHTSVDDADDNGPLFVIADVVDRVKDLDDHDVVNAFALAYETKGLGDVEAKHEAAILMAVGAARRKQGQRANGGPSKADAFALLVEALGFGALDPDAIANMMKERRARLAGKRTKKRPTK